MTDSQIRAQLNTLHVRRGILIHRIERAILSDRANKAEVAAMRTFVHAAASRIQFLTAQLG